MEIYISRDIRKFKTKDIGNFSFKEAGFIALGVGAGALTYKLTNMIEYAIPPLFVIIFIGFFKPYGMTCIQFFRTVVKEALLMPHIFINETDFEYDSTQFDELYGEKIKVSSQWNVIQTPIVKKINKKDKARIFS